jgi:hypothetical protein
MDYYHLGARQSQSVFLFFCIKIESLNGIKPRSDRGCRGLFLEPHFVIDIGDESGGERITRSLLR